MARPNRRRKATDKGDTKVTLYRKKPVVIEAVQWTGDNVGDIMRFTEKVSDRLIEFQDGGFVKIETLEGIMTANPGDYIIKGVKDEFYPCKPDIFKETYEEA